MPEYDIGFGPLRGPGDGGAFPQEDDKLRIRNLLLGIDYYKDPANGLQTAIVTATWDAPLLGEDLGKTTKNKVTEYWVSDRQGTIAQPDLTWNAERKITVRTAVFRNLSLNTLMDFRVRARTGSGIYGPYATASRNTALDTTGPKKPSTPKVKGALRGVNIDWDGLDFEGNPQENDFARCEIEVSIDGQGFGRVGQFSRGGGSFYFNTANLTARGYQARLRSFDLTGNPSPYSDVAGASSYDFVAVSEVVGQDNSVKNASFEDVSTPQDGIPMAWNRAGSVNLARRAEKARHNAFSERLSGASGDAYLWQKFAVVPDQDYVFSAYMTSGTGGSTFSDRTIMAVENTGTSTFGPSYGSLANGTQQRPTLQVKTGKDTREVEIRLYGSSGSVFWDAVQWEAGLFPTAFSPQAGEIGFGTVGTEQLADLAIVSSKIQGEAIDTPHLRANAVTTAKLTVGTLGSDVVKNGGFEDATTATPGVMNAEGQPVYMPNAVVADGWQAAAGTPTRGFYPEGASGVKAAAGKAYMQLGPGYAAIISDPFPVEQDRFYYVGAHLEGEGMFLQVVTGPTSTGLFPGAAGTTQQDATTIYEDIKGKADGSVAAPGPVNTQSFPTLRLAEGQVKIPLGHKYGRVVVYSTDSSTGYCDMVFCRKVNGSTMITDGAVYTDKVSARGVSADSVVAGRIVARVIIMAPLIEAGTINAAFVDSAYIRGGVVRASRFETGNFNETRIVMLDAGQKDAIRWYEPGSGPGLGDPAFIVDTNNDRIPDTDQGFGSPFDGAGAGGTGRGLIAEIRGGYFGMGTEPIEDYGVHLNSTVKIGNSNSKIYQTGQRVGNHPQTRVRAGVEQAVVGTNGSWSVAFNTPMKTNPNVVVAVLNQTSIAGYYVTGFAVTGKSPSGFSGTLALADVSPIVVNQTKDANGFVKNVSITGGQLVALFPGQGTIFSVMFYAEEFA